MVERIFVDSVIVCYSSKAVILPAESEVGMQILGAVTGKMWSGNDGLSECNVSSSSRVVALLARARVTKLAASIKLPAPGVTRQSAFSSWASRAVFKTSEQWVGMGPDAFHNSNHRTLANLAVQCGIDMVYSISVSTQGTRCQNINATSIEYLYHMLGARFGIW